MQTGNQNGRQTAAERQGLADRIRNCQADKLKDSQTSNSLEKRTGRQKRIGRLDNRLPGRQTRHLDCQADSS
jgi:hypothetical protein